MTPMACRISFLSWVVMVDMVAFMWAMGLFPWALDMVVVMAADAEVLHGMGE